MRTLQASGARGFSSRCNTLGRKTWSPPYTIDIPDERLAAIKAKIGAYDWSQLPDAGGWRVACGHRRPQRLVAYWRDAYDWRDGRTTPQSDAPFHHRYRGRADSLRPRARRRVQAAPPPPARLAGLVPRFERLLEPLAADGHDVFIPSLPGFAFSKPITGVIGPRRAAELVHGLMARLFGPTRYVVQGGDGAPTLQAGWPTRSRMHSSASISTWSAFSPRTSRRHRRRKRI